MRNANRPGAQAARPSATAGWNKVKGCLRITQVMTQVYASGKSARVLELGRITMVVLCAVGYSVLHIERLRPLPPPFDLSPLHS